MATCPECHVNHVLSANYKGDNEIIPGAVHRSILQLRKTSARRPSMEAVRPVIASCGPLPPNEVGRIAQHIRQEEKGMKDNIGPEQLKLHIYSPFLSVTTFRYSK